MDMLLIYIMVFAGAALAVFALAPGPSGAASLRSAEIQLVGAGPNPAAWIGALLERLKRKPKQEKDELSDLPILRPKADGSAPAAGRRRGALKAMYLRMAKFIRLSSQRASDLSGRLDFVGWALSPQEFMGFKLFSMAVWGGGVFVLLRPFVAKYPLALLMALGVGFVMPDLSLRSQVARRHKAIVRMLPEVVDLLSLCMGAGLDFLGALTRVVGVRGTHGGKKKEPLLEELSTVIQEIKLGKRRSEAMRAMAKRVDLTELSSFVRMLVQADRMGTPIAEVLIANAEDIRFERYNRAEKAALKAPIKILVPLIFCILPCVAVIVAAPIFLQFMKQGPLLR